MQPATSSRPHPSVKRHLLVYDLYKHGEAVFEGLENFRLWLERPNKALNDARPVELLTSPQGFKQVDDLLTRIEFGVY